MPDAVVAEAAGTQIIAVPRATRGRIWVSLWIDAGARDVDPPQVATVAAWVATREHPEVEARVLPDGIELTRSCRREALDACLRSLADVVRTRRPDANAILEARARLGRTRRRVAVEDARRADALALEALLERSADPLGTPHDDERASAGAVASFLADHVGPGRLLLVAVGDVEPDSLRAHVAATFAGLPRARLSRAGRAIEGARGLRVEVGDRDVVAAAVLRPNVSDAARLGRRLLARLHADHPAVTASADAFPIRGGAALVARVEDREVASAMLDHLAELAEEPPIEAPDPPAPEDGPRSLARWIGARWVARQERAAAGGFGVGAVVAGGRGDAVDRADPDAEVREAARHAIERAMRAVATGPAIEGTVDGDGADATLAGGALLRARRLPGAGRFSAVVLFEGGASEDAADAHGATALLAQLSKTSCDAVARRELGQTIDALGLDTAPLLTADAWGLRVEGPAQRWRETTFLAGRCASVPYLEPALVEEARDALLRVVRQPSMDARSAVAAMLAPGAPGRVAPAGSANTVAGLGIREIRRARAERVAAARARVALAGDVPIELAARIAARAAARWPEGLPAEPGPWNAPADHLAAHDHGDDEHAAVVAWLTDASSGSEVAARAFARTVAGALAAEPGLEARWHDGGADGGHAWAMVALSASPETLDALPAHVARALRAVAHTWPEVAESAIADAAEEQAWSASSPRRVAMTLATAPPDPPSSADAERAVRRLVESAPYYLIVRPQPGR